MTMPQTNTPPDHEPASFAGWIGVAARDITPPADIYARIWGAATHEQAQGIHQPLVLQAVTFAAGRDAEPLVLIAMDAVCFFGGPMALHDGDEWALRQAVLDALGLDESRVMMCCTHTHAGASLASGQEGKPGGALTAPYVETIKAQAIAAARAAIASAREATLTWATGRCSLAAKRDLYDKSLDRWITGTDFTQQADDTVLVGRITRDDDDAQLATIVNYACHPTTLAWENKLISPDYVGSMRDLVQERTGGAACVFLQGASGEQGPVEGFTGEVAIAERNGRQLGYGVLEALESMLPPRTKLVYQGVVESGAPLGIWSREAFDPPREIEAVMVDAALPLKADLPTEAELRKRMAEGDRVMAERARRAIFVAQAIGTGATCAVPLWAWRLGRTLLAAHPNEAYACWQQALRQRFETFAVAAINVTNTSLGVGYICPDDVLARKTLYQAWQSPFAEGSHDVLLAASVKALEAIVK